MPWDHSVSEDIVKDPPNLTLKHKHRNNLVKLFLFLRFFALQVMSKNWPEKMLRIVHLPVRPIAMISLLTKHVQRAKLRTSSTTTRDRDLQSRGAVSTGGSPLDFLASNLQYLCAIQ